MRASRSIVLAGLIATELAAAPGGGELVRMATVVPKRSSLHGILEVTANRWKRLSNGQVELRIYAGGVAGNDTDVVRKMRLGVLDAAVLTTVGLSEIEAAIQAFRVPLMYESYDELYWVLDKMRPELERSLLEKGFVVLNWLDGGWIQFFSATPVTTPDDLRAQKLFWWAGDPDGIRVWRSNGFHPVPLPGTEMATALDTGLVTALGASPLVAVLSQFFHKAPHMTDMRWKLELGATLIKREVWERLPEDVRPLLADVMQRGGDELRAHVRESEVKHLAAMTKRGLTIVSLDATARSLWAKAAKGFHSEFRGSIVPIDAFDQAMEYRNQYRRMQPHR